MADRIHPSDLSEVPLSPPDKLEHQNEHPPAPHQTQHTLPPPPKDFVYKIPTPLPNNHPSKSPRRRRCSPCCCCLAWICALLAAFLIVCAIALLVFYLLVQPKVPQYSIDGLSIPRFNVTDLPLNPATKASAADKPYLTSDIQLTINMQNPNKKIGIFYNDVQVYVVYQGVTISKGSIPSFYQGHKNTTTLRLDLQGNDVALKESVGGELEQSLSAKSNIQLQIETQASVAIKVGSLKSNNVKFRFICQVEVGAPTSARIQIVSKSCKLKM